MKLPIQIAAGLILFLVLDTIAEMIAVWLLCSDNTCIPVESVLDRLEMTFTSAAFGGGFATLFSVINFIYFGIF